MLSVIQVDCHVFIVILNVVMLNAVMLIVLAPWPQLKTMNQHFDKNYQNVSVDDITSPREKGFLFFAKTRRKTDQLLIRLVTIEIVVNYKLLRSLCLWRMGPNYCFYQCLWFRESEQVQWKRFDVYRSKRICPKNNCPKDILLTQYVIDPAVIWSKVDWSMEQHIF